MELLFSSVCMYFAGFIGRRQEPVADYFNRF